MAIATLMCAVVDADQCPQLSEILGLPGIGAMELGAGAGVVEGDEGAAAPGDDGADIGGEGRPVELDTGEGAQGDGAEGDDVGRLQQVEGRCQEARAVADFGG